MDIGDKERALLRRNLTEQQPTPPTVLQLALVLGWAEQAKQGDEIEQTLLQMTLDQRINIGVRDGEVVFFPVGGRG